MDGVLDNPFVADGIADSISLGAEFTAITAHFE